MKNAKELYMYILGALIVLGIFTITWFFLYKEMPGANKDIMLMLVGAMLSQFANVVSYFFGSSKGSADKNEMIYKSTPPPELPPPETPNPPQP
jgi:hypothetical protein